jgi:hypothetical protein
VAAIPTFPENANRPAATGRPIQLVIDSHPLTAGQEGFTSMSNHVHDDKAGRNSGGWFPLSDLANNYPDAPGFKVEGTSSEAAAKIAPHAGRLRKPILRAFMNAPDGLVPDQVAKIIGERDLTIRPRCSELRRLGLLAYIGGRRKNETGSDAYVLQITAAGIEASS